MPFRISVGWFVMLFVGAGTLALPSRVDAVSATTTEGKNGWYTRLELSYPGCPGNGTWVAGPFFPPEGRHTLRAFQGGSSLLFQVDGGTALVVASCSPAPTSGWEEYAAEYALERTAALTITSPSTNESLAVGRIPVVGTYTVAQGGDAEVVVNGVTATKPKPGNTWTATIPLADGPNTITATLTSLAGNTATASVAVNNALPKSSSSSLPPPPPASESEEQRVTSPPSVGRVRGASVSFSAELRSLLKETSRLFADVFGRKPSAHELARWQEYLRIGATTSRTELVILMREARNERQTTPTKRITSAARRRVAGAQAARPLRTRVNAAFRSVYRRTPSVSEQRYWLQRVEKKHKTTYATLVGAMQFHLKAGFRH